MKPSKGYVNDPIRSCDLVIGVKQGKIVVLKDRQANIDDNISISDLIQRVVYALNNQRLEKALTKILEKIKIYETFE